MSEAPRPRVVRVHRMGEGERERVLLELETHAPEGRPPQRRWRVFSIVILLGSVVGAGAALMTQMVRLGGWAAAATAVVLAIGWYVLGWAPDFVAGFARERERREFEAEAERILRERAEGPTRDA